MPKRLFKSNTFNNKKNKHKKLEPENASFPESSKTEKYELQHKNLKFESKMQSKLQAKQQRNKHKSFIKRQNNTSLSPHQRIQELLGKTNKKKNKNNKKKRINGLHKAQFRWINEWLYNTTGYSAMNKIRNYENEFIQYHKTYNNMVQNEWPQSPLQKIIKSITKRIRKLSKINKSKDNELKMDKLSIADFGCGDAKIAKYFDKNYNKNKNISICVDVSSFDLIALNEYVTECDISNVDLETESVDIAIFCLSLMGTNFHQYLIESHRVLKPNGLLKIAEVRSRFYGINKFEKFLNRCGFDVVTKDLDNTHFVLFHCMKSREKCSQTFPIKFDAKTILKPCVYKKR